MLKIKQQKIINGDCLDVLKTYPDNHFTSIITDPPYGLSFMGKKWDYDVPSIEIWKECLRVLKPGGTILCFAGSRTQHRMAINIEDAGFIIKDCLMWLYASGFPKSLNIGKAIDKLQSNERKVIGEDKEYSKKNPNGKWGLSVSGNNNKQIRANKSILTIGNIPFEGYGTALKPAYEPIIMAMKPNDGSYAQNALKWGVSGLNIDKCRIESSEKWYRSNKNREKTFHGQKYNKKGNTENHFRGRFPANIILDKEVAKEEPWKRFFYCAKASKAERNNGCEGLEAKYNAGSYCFRTNGSLDGKLTAPKKNNHPTVKPLKLMKYIINLIMPPKDGLLLDPFAGSGTTILAAKELGYSAIGIEREKEYCEIAESRLKSSVEKNDYYKEIC